MLRGVWPISAAEPGPESATPTSRDIFGGVELQPWN